MRIDIATLFPEMCEAVLSASIIGRARKSGKIDICCHNIRDYADNKFNRVDDSPYGGGMGMVMQAEPVVRCVEAVKEEFPGTHVVYLSPKGRRFTQTRAKNFLKKYSSLSLLCGHYEGIDQRAIDICADEEISIGDYVLTGGELGAMIVVDTISRMVDGVLAAPECFENESLYSGLLEYPQYTRPPVFRGLEVPSVLQSGNHAEIERWKLEQSLTLTEKYRKDLYSRYIKKRK